MWYTTLMKKLFAAIRKSDLETVRKLLEKDPSLVACTAKSPPKKDDGQSSLQVALKTGSFAIAALLLDMGADVNFMESEDCISNWRAPVLHDAINAAVMNCRWNARDIDGDIVVHSTAERADESFAILNRMIGMGADVNAVDSVGNSCLWRAAIQAEQILPRHPETGSGILPDRILTDELLSDLSRIFHLLIDSGARIEKSHPYLGVSFQKYCAANPVLNRIVRLHTGDEQ